MVDYRYKKNLGQPLHQSHHAATAGTTPANSCRAPPAQPTHQTKPGCIPPTGCSPSLPHALHGPRGDKRRPVAYSVWLPRVGGKSADCATDWAPRQGQGRQLFGIALSFLIYKFKRGHLEKARAILLFFRQLGRDH